MVILEAGDISGEDGYGGESIYGGKFPDENFCLKHNERGILSMANSGSYGNGSLFFVTLKAMPHLDGKNVVFGKVVHGMDVLKRLEDAGTGNGRPSCHVEIAECGELSQPLGDKDLDSRMSIDLSLSSDCKKKRKRSGSLISQTPPPAAEEDLEEPSLRKIIDTMKLVESGEKEKLMELLRERLEECGWREEMEELGRDHAKKKGRNNVIVDDIIHDITKKGRASVPNYVKEELLKHIRTFLKSSLLG